MKRKRLSAEKLHELMQLFRPVGQEVEYWEGLREKHAERRDDRREERREAQQHSKRSDSDQREEDRREEDVKGSERREESRSKGKGPQSLGKGLQSQADIDGLFSSSSSVSSNHADTHIGAGNTNDTTHVMLPRVVGDVEEGVKEDKDGVKEAGGGPDAKRGDSKDVKKEDTKKDPHKPTFFARSRRSSSRHRDSFNREKPVLVAPRSAQQQQPKVSSLFRRNTSVSSGSGSALAQENAVVDDEEEEDDDESEDESDFTDETDDDDDEAGHVSAGHVSAGHVSASHVSAGHVPASHVSGGVSRSRESRDSDTLGVSTGSVSNLRRSDTSTSIVRGFSPSKTSVSFLSRSSEGSNGAGATNGGSTVHGMTSAASTSFQQVPRQKQKMFFIESSPSESDGFGESVSKSDCSFSPLKMDLRGGESGGLENIVAGKPGESVKPVEKPKSVKHVSVQSPPKLDSTKYDDYYNDDDDDSDWDSVESDGSSVNEEPTFSREENLSGHNLVRPSLLSSMFLNNPDRLQEQIRQSKDKSRIYSKGMIPDESNSVSSKLGSMFSGQAKRVNTYTNLSEANYIVENGGLNSDGEDIARDNASVARSLGVKSADLKDSKTSKNDSKTSKNNSVADLSRFSGAPNPATVLSATPVAVATHEPVYGSILPSDVVRHSMLASEMSQSVQKSLMNQSELERRNLEALKRRHTSIDLKKMGEARSEAPEWKKEADEPADFDYHARGW